jgi:hypothetical protein
MFWLDYWWMVLIGILVLPLVSTVIFGFWVKQRDDITIESGALCWQTFIKLVSAFTVIVSGAMLFGKYIDQQEVLQLVRQNEVSRELSLREAEFLRQKLNYDSERHDRARALLGEAKKLAATLASVDSPDKESITRFEELYYADLIGVEEPQGEVERAMVRFRKKLKNLRTAPDNDLYQISLDLSRAVESELLNSENKLILQHEEIKNLLSSE